MARINPVQAQVVEVDAGAGKCVIVCKAVRGTITIEVAEDSPFVDIFTPNSTVTFSMDVQTARNEPSLEMASRDLMVQPPQVQPPVPSLMAVPMDGMTNQDISSVKSALGIPDFGQGPVSTTGTLEAVTVHEGVGP